METYFPHIAHKQSKTAPSWAFVVMGGLLLLLGLSGGAMVYLGYLSI